MPVLDAVATELATMGRAIRVEGHTDASPVQGSTYRNNWDLSAARAVTVVSHLERAHRISPTLLSASGLGSSRPLMIKGEVTPAEANRRIEIVVELAPSDVINLAAE